MSDAKTLTPEQKARKQAEQRQKRLEALRREMRKDVQTVRTIIHGTAKRS